MWIIRTKNPHFHINNVTILYLFCKIIEYFLSFIGFFQHFIYFYLVTLYSML